MLCWYLSYWSMLGSRGGTWGPDPLENHKNKGFLSNIGLGPLKIAATKPAFNGGPSFKWRFAGGPTMTANSGLLIFPPLIKLKKNN